MKSTDTSEAEVAAAGSVLVIGRSEKVLRETVDHLRRNGHTAGATNDYDSVLARYDASSIDMVVFGGMVPPATKERLSIQLLEANPTMTLIQGLAGIPGLIAAQVEAVSRSDRLEPGSVEYNRQDRRATISLRSPEQVQLTGFWGTAFIPPDPQSTSEVIFDGRLDAGRHELPLPAHIPSSVSFVVVRVGTDVYPFEVAPLPMTSAD